MAVNANNTNSIDPYNRSYGSYPPFFNDLTISLALEEYLWKANRASGYVHYLIHTFSPGLSQYVFEGDYSGLSIPMPLFNCLEENEIRPVVNWREFQRMMRADPPNEGYEANSNTNERINQSGYEGNVEEPSGRIRQRPRTVRRRRPYQLLTDKSGNLLLPRMRRHWKYRSYPFLLPYQPYGVLPMKHFKYIEYFDDVQIQTGYNYNSDGYQYPEYETDSQVIYLTFLPTGHDIATIMVYTFEDFRPNHENILEETLSKVLRCLTRDTPLPFAGSIQPAAEHMERFGAYKALIGHKPGVSAYLPENVVRHNILAMRGKPEHMARKRKTRKNR